MDHFKTAQDELYGFSSAVERMQLVESESMQMANDPRFYEDNVLDKRLAAFAGLAVVSGFMVGTAMESVFSMDKNFDLTTVDGYMQMIGFGFLTLVLVVNLLAMYIGVVQAYHTTRLMTSGACGFEMASAYYLNPNIVHWRHFAIKLMLIGLPAILISSGFRLLHFFNKEQTDTGAKWVSFQSVGSSLDPKKHPNVNGMTFSGLAVCVLYLLFGIVLYCIHLRHVQVFREKYSQLGASVPFLGHGGQLMTQVGDRRHEPDV
eukprot:TRINITY_DN10723_c0_g1_i1.p1 TRINITY_DN10723_c0_g1~~TRINITY_DN10723_c0_g1_i1.p1  ORF type:complete len:261 (-),score=66.55 TRINITY_DN10723_c0_g1_i1:100-882(-)